MKKYRFNRLAPRRSQTQTDFPDFTAVLNDYLPLKRMKKGYIKQPRFSPHLNVSLFSLAFTAAHYYVFPQKEWKKNILNRLASRRS